MNTPAANGPDERERLQRALRDPAAWIDDEQRARLGYVLRTHVLETIDQALERASLTALLVKGAALAVTVYPHPWQREMVDVDLLVDPQEEDRLLRALQAAAFEVAPVPRHRRRSSAAFGERMLTLRTGAVTGIVEVHSHLDKMVARPIDYGSLWTRSRPCPGLAALHAPSGEDHALLVILHLAAAEFDHPVAWIDLALLMGAGFDWRAFEEQARAWSLQTPSYMALRTLAALGFPAIPAGLPDRLRPSALRLRVLERLYREGDYPLRARPVKLGWPWVLRQTALRDDTLRWLGGVGRYAWRRMRERCV